MPLISRTDMSAFLHSLPSHTMALTLSRPGLELCSQGTWPWRGKRGESHANVWMSDITSSSSETLRSQTWWKGSSLYSFLAGWQTGVPAPSPSGGKTPSVFLNRPDAGKKKRISMCCWAKLLTRLRRARRAALGAVQEVLPQQVLRLRLVPGALRVVGPQAGTPGAAAGARLGDVLKVSKGVAMVIFFSLNANQQSDRLACCVRGFYLHRVVFLVVVRALAVSERAVAVQPLHSPAEGAVGCVGILLTGRLVWPRLLKEWQKKRRKVALKNIFQHI